MNISYTEIYRRVFSTHKKHANAKTQEDWNDLVADLENITNKFEVKLMLAVFDEIERVYKSKDGRTKER